MSSLPAYAELHCLSNFSFLRGASHPEELVEQAHQLGYRALAVTDECSVAGIVRAHEAAKEFPIQLIAGSEIRLEDGLKLVLLAANREGYGHLCSLITRGRTRESKGSYRLTRDDLNGGLPGCLAILIPPALPAANLPSPQPSSHALLPRGEGNLEPPLSARERGGGEGWRGSGVRGGWDEALEQARFMTECFPRRAWIAAGLFCGANDKSRLARLQDLGERLGLPLVATGDVHMHVRSRRPLQDVLTAIRLGIPVQQAGYALHPNAERHLRRPLRLARLYPRELLAATLGIAARCDFSLDSLRYEYPDEIVPAGHTPATYLRELTENGLSRHFPQGVTAEVRSQVEKELALIRELEYEPFFLTVHDVVEFANSRGILCQGRGSAANSMVCYALGITAAGPDRLNMLFERFISRERKEPPDIDVDFEHQRREEVIQYIYRKYGRDRAAIAATLITYRRRSAVRGVGKALGLAPAQLDRLAKSLAWWDHPGTLQERLSESGFDPGSRETRRFVELVRDLTGFPRHLSQHVGGFVISRGPLSRLVPIENAAMPDRSIIQWDKDDLESLKLIKVDVLALGMLSAIRRALEFVDNSRPAPLQMKAILDRGDDPAVFEMIRKADTIGVFQIESRGQMSMLPRLRPKNFYDLVIEVAIVRPGPIQGDMVHPYLQRRMDPARVAYEKEELKSVLGRTLGVPIFQEQVMHLAMVAAGFTADDADGLRRSMAAWRRKGTLETYEDKLRQGMAARGYSSEFIERICRQIRGFGEYGFPESHAASFALLAYVSSWLKHYEPAAFLAALLNSQPMGFYRPSALVQDARRHGVEVRPVDVTASDWECALEEASSNRSPITGHRSRFPAVRLGLLMVKGASEDSAKRIVAARAKSPFDSIDDLARRAGLNRRELRGMAAAGALASLAGHRRNAHWLAGGERPPGMLQDAPVEELLPRLSAPTERNDLVADYASLGLTLGRHPLALLRRRLQHMRLATAADLRQLPTGKPARTAGIVTGRQRPQTAKGTTFVTLEDETGYTNVVVWSSLGERQRRELLGSSLLGVEGVMQKEGDVVHLVARRLTDYSRLLGSLVVKSRDFH